jgi:hypothetical protein
MVTMRKSYALTLIVILAISSLVVFKPSFAAIPKPSVPEFTVRLVDNSYDVPTTYSIDPYTGQSLMHPGYRVENKTIEITITNQPYVPYTDSNGTATFYYNIRMKGHFEDEWGQLYSPDAGFIKRSNSAYTVVSYTIGEHADRPIIRNIPGGQVDFQVQALIGFTHRGYDPNATNQLDMFPWVFDGETSDWSNTQTITIASNSEVQQQTQPSPNENSVSNQSGAQSAVTQPSSDWMEISLFTALGVIALLLAVIIIIVKHKATIKKQS